MTEVKSNSELKAALERGETEFHTTNKNLLYASALVSKFKSKLDRESNASKSVFESIFPPEGAVMEISGGTIVVTMMVLATAIALYAIYKDYDIEVDLKRGTIKATKKRR